jgi:hypothetical protein
MPLTELVRQHASDQIPPDAAIWYEGLAEWVPLAAHPELQSHLGGRTNDGAAPMALATSAASDDELDRQFGDLIKRSWDYFNENLFSPTRSMRSSSAR